MFYFIINKLLGNAHYSSRTFKVLILGSICYIILHAYLFSHSNEDSEFIKRIRGYIYYMFVADALLTGTMMWLFGSPSKDEDCDNENNDNENNDNENDDNENNDNENNDNKFNINIKKYNKNMASDNSNALKGRSTYSDIHKKLLLLKLNSL